VGSQQTSSASISIIKHCYATDTTKKLMSSPKCMSVEVINNLARQGSNHMEINYNNNNKLKRTLRWKINVRIKQ